MSNNKPKQRETLRLNPDAYGQLEQQCNALYVDRTTTELQAGYMLGIQKVLQLLREGFVVGR